METELLLGRYLAHLQGLCQGQDKSHMVWGAGSCTHRSPSSGRLAVLVFGSIDPQKEVWPQRLLQQPQRLLLHVRERQ